MMARQWLALALIVTGVCVVAGWALWRLLRPAHGRHEANSGTAAEEPSRGLVGTASVPVTHGSMNLAEERALHTATASWGLPDDGGWTSGACWPGGGGGGDDPDEPYRGDGEITTTEQAIAWDEAMREMTDDQWLASLRDDPGVEVAAWSPVPATSAPVQDARMGPAEREFWQELPVLAHQGTRLADTGDVTSAHLLAEIAQELRAQDADTAAWLSKFRQDCQQARLDLTGALA